MRWMSDGEIVSERTQLPSLILQIVNQLGIFSVFPRENLLEFEDRRVDGDSTVSLEDVGNLSEDGLSK